MKASMDRALFLIKSYIKMYRVYPGAVFMRLIGLPAQMLMYVFLWTFIGKTNPIDIKYMITYYLITGVLSMAYPYHYVAVDMEKEVMEGMFANFLVRPHGYIVPKISKFVAWEVIYAIVYLPVLAFAVIYNRCNMVQVLCFVLFSILGMFVEFMTWYTIGHLALFFEHIKGMIRILLAIRAIISGALIPLSYMPDVFQHISDYMPFQCYIYVPTQMLLGENMTEQCGKYFVIYVCWTIVLALFSKLLWKIGCTKVQSNMA